jgi:hypothetical protein
MRAQAGRHSAGHPGGGPLPSRSQGRGPQSRRGGHGAAGGCSGRGQGGQRELEEFQEALETLGTKRLPDALQCLRRAGQVELAKRLQRRSRVRNGVAHPDPSLLLDLRRFATEAAADGVERFDIPTEAGSTSTDDAVDDEQFSQPEGEVNSTITMPADEVAEALESGDTRFQGCQHFDLAGADSSAETERGGQSEGPFPGNHCGSGDIGERHFRVEPDEVHCGRLVWSLGPRLGQYEAEELSGR